MKTTKYGSGSGLRLGVIARIAAVVFIVGFFLVRGLYAAEPPRFEEHEGEVEVLHEDRDTGSRYIYFLHTAIERLELRFAADAPALVSGDRIRARGLRTNGVLALTSGAGTQTLSSGLANTFGLQKTLVILVNFANNPLQPYTLTSAQTVVDTTSNFDLENSFGQASLDATVVGWYTINFTSASCDYNTIASLAEQAASAHGVSVSSYPRRVYAFPQFSACSWWGLGSVGGNPSRAWINGSLQLRVLGHEMGHNLGLYHSHSLACAAGSCTASEYGDTHDIMGSSAGHYNAYQKERLGWLNYNISPPITTVTTDGVYWAARYETQDTDPKALKIFKGIDPSTGKNAYYYVEYRAGVGFDSGLASGVILHTATEGAGNTSNLWDLDQTTTTSDWILNVGQPYYDAAADVNITVLSIDATGASVSVTFGGGGTPPPVCTNANPTVSVSPSVAWVVGAMANYTVKVTNNDSSVCAPSTFNLAASLPAGWSAAFGSLAPLAPGASGSASLQLSAAAGAADGYYNFSVTARNAAAPSYAASASATEVCCSGALAAQAATDKATYLRNSLATVTVNVRVGQTPAAGVSATVQIVAPSGAATNAVATTDANGNAVIKYKLAAKAAMGTYRVSATANGGGYSGAASTSFNVTSR
jgi:Gametolysin peptidase M11/NPCBM-associated, NEW3 domain of alpha-galactosidase